MLSVPEAHIRYNAGYHFLVISAEEAAPFLIEKDRRVIVRVKDQLQLHVQLKKLKTGGYGVYLNKATCKKLDIRDGDLIPVTIRVDDTKYKAPMPETLLEVLESDPEAYHIFENLTPGKQRNIIFMVAKAKRLETQIDRALLIMEKLKLGERNPMNFLKKG
ncbi:MAG: YdeI/OmpD-associated family protein [Bacteroidota bacterium]